MMIKVQVDRRLKLTRTVENKIIVILRQWNSKITWRLLIERIKAELDLEITKPTLRKVDKICSEFDKAKARYNGVSKLNRSVVMKIGSGDVNYYEKYKACVVEKKVLQEVIDEQYALIERIFKNVEEIPGLNVADLVQMRAEDME